MPCNPLCGIKVREGKLEAKLRVAALGQGNFASLAGHLEGYRKWSLEFAADEQPSEDDLIAVDWLPLIKRRQLQRFEVVGSRVTPTAVRPANGCEFEMTELTVRSRRFWTVGFEAVGSPDRILDNLRCVAAHVVQRGGLQQPFTESNSYGYAQWLSRSRLTGGTSEIADGANCGGPS
jgi:hypothetical protein